MYPEPKPGASSVEVEGANCMKHQILKRLLVCATLSAAVVAADDVHKPKTANPAIGDPAAIEAGRKIFSTGCAGCHGLTGEGGRGPKLRDSGMWHTLEDDALFAIIKKGIPNTEMPGSNQPDEKVWQLTAYVKSLGSPAVEAPPPGNVQNGEQLFWGKAGCSGCHGVRGQGGKYGPDLANLAGSKSVGAIRESILDPDADATEFWRKVVITQRDGGKLEGLLRNRNNFSLQIQDSKGNVHLLPTSDIRDITLSKSSPMPQDYKKRLSRREQEDLIAYLSRLSLRPAESVVASAEKK